MYVVAAFILCFLVANSQSADTEPPKFTFCPSDVVIKALNTLTRVVWRKPEAVDNSGHIPQLISNYALGLMLHIGQHNVEYIARDKAGNTATCKFKVTVKDTEPPKFTFCPSDMVVERFHSLPRVEVWRRPEAVDNSGRIPQLISNYAFGVVLHIGQHNVEYIARDKAGNTATCKFKVTVKDTEPPKFTFCPSHVVVKALNTSARVVWRKPEAVDNSGHIPQLISNYPLGVVLHIGQYNVEYIARDKAGNTATCNFMVIVKDTEPPKFTFCPSDIVIETLDTSTRVVWRKPEAVDNSGHIPQMSNNFNPGIKVYTGYYHTVEYIARDDSYNTATCKFKVTVKRKVVQCPKLHRPAHGALVCNSGPDVTGRFCVANCESGYDFPFTPSIFYMCSDKGKWSFIGVNQQAPDCSVRGGPSHFQTYYYKGDANDPAVQVALKNNLAKGGLRGFVCDQQSDSNSCAQRLVVYPGPRK